MDSAEYVALPNVAGVGGSWITPKTLQRDGEFATIQDLAKQASSL